MGITQELARYCSGLKFIQLADEVVDRVKFYFLDFIGMACQGSREDSSKSMYRFVMKTGRGYQNEVIIGTKQRVSYLYATLANGTSSHAIEMDDVNRTRGGGSRPKVPSVLPEPSVLDASGAS